MLSSFNRDSATLGLVNLIFPGLAVRLYDDAGNVIQTHEYKGDFKEW